MIDWSTVKRVHLMGICGTGMGSLAGMLKAAGHQVTGSDENVYPPMSTQLERWGIEAMSGYRAENLDRARPDLVIVGNVIRQANPEAAVPWEQVGGRGTGSAPPMMPTVHLLPEARVEFNEATVCTSAVAPVWTM